MSGSIYEGWVVVFESGTDYEADLVRDRLDDAGIPAIVLTQRDHAFNLTIGDLAQVHVLVPPMHVEAAARLLTSPLPSDEELEQAALAAAPSPDAHDPETQALLDSGNVEIRLSVPREEDESEQS
ncbi:MAG: DUF2007 domain-containing protein [Bacteroidetes bacterium]|nr:DUF2007 domain-containing protein [Bacteroidota bacterium]